jgi:hypothetical protein
MSLSARLQQRTASARIPRIRRLPGGRAVTAAYIYDIGAVGQSTVHFPLPSSGRLMRVLSSIVAPSTAFMAFCDPKMTGCGSI